MLLLLERTAQAVHTEQLTGPCRGRDRAMLCLALGPEHSNSSSNSSQDLGLMNQHLAVINFVTLGVVLGADELELPLLQSRSSLAAFATWTARDPAGLWNTTLLRSYLAGTAPAHFKALVSALLQDCLRRSYCPARSGRAELELQARGLVDVLTPHGGGAQAATST